MSKTLKWLYSLASLLLVSLLAFVVVVSQRQLILPSEWAWLNTDLQVPTFIEEHYHFVYFWLALIFIVIILVTVLVVIFYPRTYTEIPLLEKDTSLLLKKSALEGYIHTCILESNLLVHPSVTVTMYKKKFKVHVKGAVTNEVGFANAAVGAKKVIEDGIQQYIGVDRPVNFKVFVDELQTVGQTGRVVNRVL
ncbi:Uncharacterised protein [Chlamydia trachomatis]|nr:Uncharacterised protein [Chlamydia trachomatis]